MVDIANYFILQIGAAITFFINLLPQSPFTAIMPTIDTNFFRFVNYVIPLREAFAIMQLYLSSLVSYFAIRIVLRWLKVASA